jgi:hypothetical protein
MNMLSRSPAGTPRAFPSSSSRLCTLAAVGLLLVGVLLAAHRLATFKRTEARLSRKHRELGELEKLHSEVLTVDSARSLWRQRHGSRPEVPLQELLSAALPPEAAVEIQHRAPTAVDPGWSCQRAALTLRAARIESVVDLCRQLETAEPPWRITRIQLTSSTRSAGTANAALELQTLIPSPAR